MAEKGIVFQSGGLDLEGLYEDQPGDRGVVVAHPHPLYGGSMHNNVVGAVVEAYGSAGWSTLRFNFRGAGGSQGRYGEGKGEKDDVRAAVRCLRDWGKHRIHLAGYSFGAWVIALGLDDFNALESVVMVSPPVSFIDFSFLGYHPEIRLIIAGTGDDIGQLETIQTMLPTWNPEADLRIIQGADHFYGGREQEITSIVQSFLGE